MVTMNVSVFCLMILRIVLTCNAATTTVHTSIGTILGFKGKVILSGKEKPLLKFLGIPYGESTAGSQRFKKPIPKAPFKTTFHATKIAPRCYEGNSDLASIRSKNYTEDCLYLNIVVPGDISNVSSLPVMLWIHGGGFAYGTSGDYNAGALVAYGNVVVVTINYRLGVFGFLRSPDGTLIGNQGLWDQHLAIKWVHNHIGNFYGNPNEITIFGESAGSQSVTHQAMFAGNQGQFRRAIAESGSAVSYWTLDDPNSADIFQRAGCGQNTLADRIECLRGKSAVDLAMISGNVISAGTVDGDFILERPKQIVYGNNPVSQKARDFFGSLDILLGANGIDGCLDLPHWWSSEFGFNDINSFKISWKQLVDVMIPKVVETQFPRIKSNKTKAIVAEAIAFEYKNWKNPDDPEYPRNTVIDMTSDYSYFGPVVDTVRPHSRLNQGRTYMYEFAMIPTNHVTPTPIWRHGATHGDELPFVFGEPVSDSISSYTQGFTYTHDEERASYAMMAMWTNFAKTGDPNKPMSFSQYTNATWLMYDETSRYYMKMASPFATTSAQKRLSARNVAFWIDFLPQLIHDLEPSVTPHFNPSSGLIG